MGVNKYRRPINTPAVPGIAGGDTPGWLIVRMMGTLSGSDSSISYLSPNTVTPGSGNTIDRRWIAPCNGEIRSATGRFRRHSGTYNSAEEATFRFQLDGVATGETFTVTSQGDDVSTPQDVPDCTLRTPNAFTKGQEINMQVTNPIWATNPTGGMAVFFDIFIQETN